MESLWKFPKKFEDLQNFIIFLNMGKNREDEFLGKFSIDRVEP